MLDYDAFLQRYRNELARDGESARQRLVEMLNSEAAQGTNSKAIHTAIDEFDRHKDADAASWASRRDWYAIVIAMVALVISGLSIFL